jgi:hypothetical protein
MIRGSQSYNSAAADFLFIMRQRWQAHRLFCFFRQHHYSSNYNVLGETGQRIFFGLSNSRNVGANSLSRDTLLSKINF